MRDRLLRLVSLVFLPVGLGLFALWLLAGIFRARSPDVELVRGLQEAFRQALAAERSARRAASLSSLVRLAALVAGVAAPLAAAYLVHRLAYREEVTPEDLLDALESEKLIRLGEHPERLADRTEERLLEATDDGEADGKQGE
jgi:hypothetical protein